MLTLSGQADGAAETNHRCITQQAGNPTDYFARLVLMRGNDKTKARRPGPQFVQRLMCCLQAGFAPVERLRVSNGSCKSHFVYPSATGIVKWNVVPPRN